jgi:hypothetical protein
MLVFDAIGTVGIYIDFSYKSEAMGIDWWREKLFCARMNLIGYRSIIEPGCRRNFPWKISRTWKGTKAANPVSGKLRTGVGVLKGAQRPYRDQGCSGISKVQTCFRGSLCQRRYIVARHGTARTWRQSFLLPIRVLHRHRTRPARHSRRAEHSDDGIAIARVNNRLSNAAELGMFCYLSFKFV